MPLPIAEERDDSTAFMTAVAIAGGPDRALEPAPHAGERTDAAGEGYVEFESEIRVEGEETPVEGDDDVDSGEDAGPGARQSR